MDIDHCWSLNNTYYTVYIKNDNDEKRKKQATPNNTNTNIIKKTHIDQQTNREKERERELLKNIQLIT